MIARTGIFPHNEYFEHSYELDRVQPQAMGRTHAVVLALDMSEQPFARRMDYDISETASDEEIRRFHARFEKIDEKNPGLLPLQVYDGEPLVRRTVENLVAAGVSEVTVVAKTHLDEIGRVLHGLDVKLLELDCQAVDAYDGGGAVEEIAYLSCGLLSWLRASVGLGRRCDSLLVVHADEATFKARHYRKLRVVFEEHPESDCIPAYVEWRATLPALFPLRFIDELAARGNGTTATAQGASRLPVRTYKVTQCLMGEEKLVGGWLMPAKALSKDPADALPSLAAGCVCEVRSGVDAVEAQERKVTGFKPEPALERARTFLEKLDASLADDPIEGLAEAQAFAERNRLDYPVLNARENAGLVYLDAAATSLRPSCVIDACTEYAQHYSANIWRGVYPSSVAATAKYQAARESVAKLIGADPRDCIFTANTSDAINLVARSWARCNLSAGDLVLVAANEHHSNMLPWALMAEELGTKVAYIPVDEFGRLDRTAYRELLERSPKLVCIAHISNIVGLENPVADLAAAAHAVGACVMLDCAQSVAHVPVDVDELGVDFIAFSGHKMHAPTGIGVLWARPERVREMMPTDVGGGVISEVSYEGTYYRQSPYLFELGTPPIEQAIGLGAAARYLQVLGMGNIRAHARVMSLYALRCMSLVPKVGILGEHSCDDGALGLLSFAVPGIGSTQVSMLLARMGIATRAGAHCAVPFTTALGVPGSTRISFGPYTTREDVEAWGFAMSEIARMADGSIGRS